MVAEGDIGDSPESGVLAKVDEPIRSTFKNTVVNPDV